jgi:perosamine synthetase
VSSGTAGLFLALQALGISEGDEVIVPSFAFIAVANVVVQCRARPVFADIDPVTLNLTADSIRAAITPRCKAILVVHTFGVPADMEPILALAREYSLGVIEDACEALGASYRGRKAGSLGDVGVFSFYPNKLVTTGEGGAVITRDRDLAGAIRALRNHGRGGDCEQPRGYAANYRLADINCALGIAQLGKLDAALALREQLARRYCEALRNFAGISLPCMAPANDRISWFAFVVRISGTAGRDRVMEALAKRGIASRAYFPAIHLQPGFSGYAGQKLPVTEDMTNRTLALPFFNQLTEPEVRRVCEALGAALHSGAAI